MNRMQRVLRIASEAHDQMKSDPAAASAHLTARLDELSRIKAGSDREDVSALAQSTAVYLNSMARHPKYMSAFQAGLDNLRRQGASGLEHEREDELRGLHKELETLRAQVKQHAAGGDDE